MPKGKTGPRKTICVNGHPRTPEKNLYMRSSGTGVCKLCAKLWRAKWVAKQPIEVTTTLKKLGWRSKHQYQKRKLKLIELAGGKCVRCGYDEFACALDFDHIYPEQKTSTRPLAAMAWKAAVEELKTRQLLCANCHRIKTWLPLVFEQDG